MTAQSLLAALISSDTLVFLPVAGVAGLVALRLRRRPVTRARAMEVALETSLRIMMTARTALLAAVSVLAPTMLLGSGWPTYAPVIACSVYLATSAVGLVAVRGGVGRRFAGAAFFLVVSIVEAFASIFVLSLPLVARMDAVLTLAVAGGTLLFAAMYWTKRIASPNPLGPGGQPFDY